MTKPDIDSDPFRERVAAKMGREFHLLGARFLFESNHPQLLELADWAYAGLPRQKLSSSEPQLRLRLELLAQEPTRGRAEPPPLQMLSSGGLLGGATGPSNFVVLSPPGKEAFVGISQRMLRYPYHIRYELIEFAVFTLAARAQGLVSMHGACVGRAGRGVLLMGPSGAGKSTVTLQCLLEGFSLLCEDSVFVTPDTLLATGVANFLHVRADSLKWVPSSHERARIRGSKVIQRRSGVRKYEVDLRSSGYPLADRALRIGAIVFLSARNAAGQPLLKRLGRAETLRRLVAEQAYAAGQPPWATFTRNVGRLPAFELRRGQHPSDSAAALRAIIGSREGA